MKELKFISAQPDDVYYTWQVHLWLESLKEIGQSDKAVVLIFTPNFRQRNEKWQQIVDLYPEAEFRFYKDEHNISSLLGVYIPVLRPYVLWRYFTEFPEMENNVFFYCDSDILFNQNFNIDKYINDDVCYLSDTNGYINASYFDSKAKDVLPNKFYIYKTRDILRELTEQIGITREIAEDNNLNSGGAQYLLKNINASFWEKVMQDCITIRIYLQTVNREFFENESTGFQSWCADMWAVLWNLWKTGHATKVVKELDFAWSTDPIERLDKIGILHNAGITGSHMDGLPVFYKGTYHAGLDPTKDPHLDEVLSKNKIKCTWHYANKLKQLKLKYNLNY